MIAILRRMTRQWWRVVALLAGIVVLYVVFRSLGERERAYDTAILRTLAAVFGVWCLVMLWRTRRWEVIALAVFAAFAGDALFYTYLGDAEPDGWGMEWLYLTRATFVCAALLLIVQLVIDLATLLARWWRVWRERRQI